MGAAGGEKRALLATYSPGSLIDRQTIHVPTSCIMPQPMTGGIKHGVFRPSVCLSVRPSVCDVGGS